MLSKLKRHSYTPSDLKMKNQQESLYNIIEPEKKFNSVANNFIENGYELIFYESLIMGKKIFNHGIFTVDKKKFFKEYDVPKLVGNNNE
jgi:hypothetical protein